MYVRDILASKGSAVITINPSETIGALCKLLREKRIGAAVVSSNGKAIVGVITERDITYGLAVHGEAFHGMSVAEVMTKAVITCAPGDPVAIVASTMLSRNVRHIPVEVNGAAAGMVSIRDVLNFRVVDLQQQAAQLRVSANQMERTPQDRE